MCTVPNFAADKRASALRLINNKQKHVQYCIQVTEPTMFSVIQVFNANTDANTIKSLRLPKNIRPRYVRFYPTKVEKQACLRVGLFGGTPIRKYSDWSDWAPCDLKKKIRFRQRFCDSPNKAVDCPNADAVGVQTETKNCTVQELNGMYT